MIICHTLPKSHRHSVPRVAAVSAALLCVVAAANAVTLPAPPMIFDASYAAPTGHTITVNAGGNLQAALDQAQLGDIVVLQAGASFTGPFTLPNKSSGSGWIYVESSAYAQLPAPGTRISPSDASMMPKVIAPANGNAMVTVSGSHHFRFVGIEFKTATNTYTVNVVQLDNNDKSTATLANHITFDRCYFLADTSIGARRGLLANGAYVAVVDSYFEGFREKGADSQAIVAYSTSGPIKIVNNYLSGAGENTMFGGAPSANASLIPSDIEIRGNYFFKPLSWVGAGWVVKNSLEFKDAKRVLVTENVFENNWLASQSGFTLLVTPRADAGATPWSGTEDIAITNNRFVNIGSGINILGSDNLSPTGSLRTARVLIENNLISVNGLNGAHGWAFMLLDGPTDVTIDHNTVLASGAILMAENAAGKPKNDRFTMINNIAVANYGLLGSGTAAGLGTLNADFSNATVTKNALTSGPASAYPQGNFFPANESAIRFVNVAGGNYALASDSPYKGAATDGLDLGADAALLPGALSGPIIAPPAISAVPQAPLDFQVR